MPVYLDLFGSYARGHQAGQVAAARRQDYILRQTKGWLDLQARYRFAISPNDLKPPQLPDDPFFRKQQRDVVRVLAVRLKGVKGSGGGHGRSAGSGSLAGYSRYARIGRGLLQGQADLTGLHTSGGSGPQKESANPLVRAEAAPTPRPVAPDMPSIPDTPGVPSAPGAPDTPIIPDTPSTPDVPRTPAGFQDAPPVSAGTPIAETVGSIPMDAPPVPPGLGYQPPGAGYLPPQDVAPVVDRLPTRFIGPDVVLPLRETGMDSVDELRKWLMGNDAEKGGGGGQ